MFFRRGRGAKFSDGSGIPFRAVLGRGACFRRLPTDLPRKNEKIPVDNRGAPWYNTQAIERCTPYRGVEQSVARRAHNPEVVGSSPASATIKIPGIRDEYRDSSCFFTGNENGAKVILANFGPVHPKIAFWGHRPAQPGGLFYAFFRRSTSAMHSEALTLFSSMMWE